MSLIALPLLLRFRKERGREVLRKTVEAFSGPAAIYLPVLPFIIIQLIARQGWPNGNQNLIGDLDNFSQHMIVFLYGCTFSSSMKFWDRIEKNRAISLAVGSACFLMVLAVAVGVERGYATAHPAVGATTLVLRSISTWCWLLAILGYGKKYLNSQNRAPNTRSRLLCRSTYSTRR